MATENPSLVTVDESACQRFEAAWQEGRPEPIEQFLRPGRCPNPHLTSGGGHEA
jgi:hypothetical protein